MCNHVKFDKRKFMKKQRSRINFLIANILFAFTLNAFAFRGDDPCNYSDCSGGYSDFGFFQWIFFICLSIYICYIFFTKSEFRSSVYRGAAWILLVIVFPLTFLKQDKDIAMTLVVVMFFVVKWINSLLDKRKSDVSEQINNGTEIFNQRSNLSMKNVNQLSISSTNPTKENHQYGENENYSTTQKITLFSNEKGIVWIGSQDHNAFSNKVNGIKILLSELYGIHENEKFLATDITYLFNQISLILDSKKYRLQEIYDLTDSVNSLLKNQTNPYSSQLLKISALELSDLTQRNFIQSDSMIELSKNILK